MFNFYSCQYQSGCWLALRSCAFALLITISLFVCESAAATLHKTLTLAEPDAEPRRVGEPCSCASSLIWMGSHCHVIPRLLWVRLRSAGDTLLQSDSHMTAALV